MSKSTAAPQTKTAILKKLLRRKSGTDVAALQAATGWQPHSIRAALSRLRKKAYTIDRIDPTKPNGRRVYRITSSPESGQ